LHDGRARRAHHKRCHPFFELIHSFSAGGQNVDFWLLSKNNTDRLPLRGILPVNSPFAAFFNRTWQQTTATARAHNPEALGARRGKLFHAADTISRRISQNTSRFT